MYYKNNNLYIENVKAQSISNKIKTPFYCYSLEKLRKNINNFKRNFTSFNPLICFSVKSNNNLNILKQMKMSGLGADVVSKGELLRVLKAGINPKKIVFSGVGKTENEIKFAIEKKILLINAESESELATINKIAKKKQKVVNIGLRLNPNIDAKTLKKISTGRNEDKFGMSEKNFIYLVNKYKKSSSLRIRCLSVHIGSQILDHHPYSKMIKVINKVIMKSKHQFEFIDLGGGMGINYDLKSKSLNYKKYNFEIQKLLKKHNAKIIFEPGRSIIGDTAILITKVIYVKSSPKKNFIILDAAMNDFMRPALYGSFHRIIPLRKKKNIVSS